MKSVATLVLLALLTAFTISRAHNGRSPIPFPTKTIIDSNYAGAQAAHPADIDGDGDIDILGASRDATSITWWENSAGDATTWVKHDIDTAVPGAIIALGYDIDGDGDTDVLGAAFNSSDVAWWENTAGDGSNWTRHDIDTNVGSVYDVIATDLDHDGDLDVIGAASSGNEVAWWQNVDGTGTNWSKSSIDAVPFASAVTAADINSDGYTDIVAASGTGDSVTWWANNGDATSWTAQTVASNYDFAHWVDAADVDGDGDIDVLATALNDNDVAWWENTASDGSSWTRHNIDNNFGGAHSVTAADLDQDGDMDVLGAALSADLVTWWENLDGAGTSWQTTTIDPFFDEAHSVAATDLDGDGDLDVLGAARTANDIAWWHNDTIHSNAVYTAPLKEVVANNYNGAFGVNAADIDADGDTDILGVAAAANQVTWWSNNDGMGTNWSATTIDGAFATARALTVADINQDGSLDVAAAAVNGNDISWWSNQAGDGSTWTETLIDGNFTGAFWIHSDDVDSDGDIDIIGAAFSSNQIAWWENSAGDGSAWTKHTVANGFTTAVGVHSGDYDGDGDIDIAGAAFGTFPTGTNGRILWWENTDGTGTSWTPHDVDTNYLGAVGIHSADVDGDGDLDLLGAANIDEEFTWWQNLNGDGTTWARQAVGTGFANAESVYGADLDADGDIDILGGSQNDNTVAWWENVAQDGTTWVEHIVDDNIGQAVAVYAADINGDAATDILAAAAVDNEIVWYPNVGGQLSLTSTNIAPATLPAGQATPLFTLTATHNGRSADSPLTFTRLHLLAETAPDIPMTNTADVIDTLTLYLDDGSGTFEAGQDTPVNGSTIIDSNNGRIELSFEEDQAALLLQPATPRTYFVVVRLTPDADQQQPAPFLLTHLTDETEAADDVADIPVRLAHTTNTTATIQATELQSADLALHKGVNKETAVVGEAIIYTLTFTNSGNITSTHVILTDTMPTPIIDITISSNWPITPHIGATTIWDIAPLPPTATGIITITGHLTATTDTTLTNNAIITGRNDLNMANNSATVVTPITSSQHFLYLPVIQQP